MHFGRIVGTVVATAKTPGLVGRRLCVVAPTDSRGQRQGEEVFVAVDLVRAAPGQWIFYVRAREAANALSDPDNPVDAAIVGIVDVVHRHGERIDPDAL